jgi:hypothetical protein
MLGNAVDQRNKNQAAARARYRIIASEFEGPIVSAGAT